MSELEYKGETELMTKEYYKMFLQGEQERKRVVEDLKSFVTRGGKTVKEIEEIMAEAHALEYIERKGW